MTKEFKQKIKEVFLKSNEITGGNQLALFWVFEYAEMDRLKRERSMAAELKAISDYLEEYKKKAEYEEALDYAFK